MQSFFNGSPLDYALLLYVSTVWLLAGDCGGLWVQWSYAQDTDLRWFERFDMEAVVWRWV